MTVFSLVLISFLFIFVCDSVNETPAEFEAGDVSNSSAISISMPNGTLPEDNFKWRTTAVHNGLILIVAVLVMLSAVIGYRYIRSEKRRTRTKKYSKLNVNPNDDDDIELDIYERK